MPIRDLAPNGAPTWVDVMTSDPAATQAFYSELFGWTVVDPGPDYGGYFNFHLDGVPVAGGMKNDPAAGMPDFWSVYFATPDAAATMAAAEANGGAVFLPAQPVMGLGTLAMVAGPGGGAAGLWQPAEHTGFGVHLEPNAPNWFELHTRSYEADLAFYTEVLGWTTVPAADEPGFRYTMVLFGEEGLAGVMDASIFPDDAPLGWSVYFGAADAEATAARAVELGATLTIGPDHTPYGTLVGLTDPTGAPFKLQQPPADG